ERTDEGMELILRAWKEPQPFAWQGRHFHYRTVSVWPKPLQQPLPPMYALGTSSEASDFAARNHIGLGVSFGPFDAMGKVTGYYKKQCARWGWQPEPHEIVAQLKEARAEIGCGVVDLSFQTPGSEGPDELMEALELFGKKVLPYIREI